jgi:amino-acid N-acetyltransferase
MTASTDSIAATIRPAEPGDLGSIEELLTESNLPTIGVREALGDFFVAYAEGRLVGVAGLEVRPNHALLRSVAVRPEWRSKGVGRALVHTTIDAAEARGIQGLYLLTTTAERYFPSFGFETIAREQVPDAIRNTGEFASACPSSATVMKRTKS